MLFQGNGLENENEFCLVDIIYDFFRNDWFFLCGQKYL